MIVTLLSFPCLRGVSYWSVDRSCDGHDEVHGSFLAAFTVGSLGVCMAVCMVFLGTSVGGSWFRS